VYFDLRYIYTHFRGAEHCVPPYPQPHAGITNFRDLATTTFTSTTGQPIHLKPGQFYRSSRLYGASHTSVYTLFSPEQLGIQFVADFRSDEEVWLNPDPVASIHTMSHQLASATQYNLSDSATWDLKWEMLSGRMGPEEMQHLMKRMNKGFALEHRHHFSSFLQDIARPSNVPFLIHCTAGKDRTGWATGLILRLLGVQESEIVADYLASNCGWDPTAKYNAVLLRLMSLLRTDKIAMEKLLRVDRSYLEEGFQAVLGKWGTWERYYQQGLGIQDVDVFRRGLRKALLVEEESGL
jgi:protein-tyrosine phosphatase